MVGMTENLLNELMKGAEEAEEGGGLPPGFRFHPTDEELITFYLASKVFNGAFFGFHIPELDLNRCEPWDLPDAAKMGEREWYFFSLRDRKYPTGLRTNRATGAGYWKATGKDKEIRAASSAALLGMKKTLVFYRGRAPRGEKTKWVMHEYRLEGDFSCRHTCKEEWVMCRIFHKSMEKRINPLLFHGQMTTTTYDDVCDMQDNQCLLLQQNPNFPVINKNSQDIINDIKSMMSQTNHHSPSILIKSLLLSHQQHDQASAIPVSKQCKTEPILINSNFHNFTTSGAAVGVMENGHDNLFTFDNVMDCYYGDVAAATNEVPPFGGSGGGGGGFSRAMVSWPVVPSAPSLL